MSDPLIPEVVVNGEVVPRARIAAEAQHHPAPREKPGLAWRKAANAVVMRTLLLQQARHRGLESRPVEVGPGRWETDEEALIRDLLDTAVVVDIPSEEDVRAEWARDPSRFRAPPLWEVSHILIACDPRDATATEAARVQAIELATKAKGMSDPRGFARLASEHSECGSRTSGGALGQLGPGDTVPEFEAALHGMAAGDITPEPVLSRHGWHIIRMDAVAEGDVLPFEAVSRKIMEAMEKAAWTRAARSFVDGLVSSAEISGADLDLG